MKDIEEILKIAEQEYTKNGRSERFITIENHVLASQNDLLLVKFARLEGARIKSLAIGITIEEETELTK